MKVSLDYIMLRSFQSLGASSEKDSSPLTPSFRFNDKSFSLLLVQLLIKGIPVLRQKPGWRVKHKLISIDSLHLIKITSEMILPRQRVHSREVINSLVVPEPNNLIWSHTCVIPNNIPVFLFIPCNLIAKFLSLRLNARISGKTGE